jgi:hypothetical protein
MMRHCKLLLITQVGLEKVAVWVSNEVLMMTQQYKRINKCKEGEEYGKSCYGEIKYVLI